MQPTRKLAWLRNSMRKTSPITMPDMQHELSTEDNLRQSTSNNCLLRNEMSRVDESFDSSSQSFNTVYYDDNDAGNDSLSTHIPELPQNTSTPTAMTTTSSELSEEDILNVINSSDPDSPSRPRQLGRRSDPRPRVTAIDVSSAESRHISYTSQRTTTTSSPTTGVQMRPQLAPPSQYIHSVPSSLGTSRNTSPVSIVSSTASSSNASAAQSQR